MLSMVKMMLKGEVGGHALYSHGNYIVDHGKSLKNPGIEVLNFCGNPASFNLYCMSHDVLRRLHMSSSSLNLTVTICFGLTLQICLIMVLSCFANTEGSAWSLAKIQFQRDGTPFAKSLSLLYLLVVS